jgi:hypothetical protein
MIKRDENDKAVVTQSLNRSIIGKKAEEGRGGFPSGISHLMRMVGLTRASISRVKGSELVTRRGCQLGDMPKEEKACSPNWAMIAGFA